MLFIINPILLQLGQAISELLELEYPQPVVFFVFLKTTFFLYLYNCGIINTMDCGFAIGTKF